MNAGDVFHLVGVAEAHDWVIISDPTIDPEKILFVNFTSSNRYTDPACVLNVGDHPRIRHATAIEYARAKVAADRQLEVIRAAQRMQIFEPVRPDILKRIRDGAMASKRMTLENAQILLDQGLVEEM